MDETIIAVGGTGQMVLHYYTVLFLIGVIEVPFQAVVIDSDKLMPSLADFSQLFDVARLTMPEKQVPVIEYLPVTTGVGSNVRELLTGENTRRGFHPAEAFFDEVTLAQRVEEGLYARPALSAVMGAELDFRHVHVGAAEKVLVTGSIIGGTGGGLIAPLLATLPDEFAVGASPSIRAMLFGEFFRPDPDHMSDAEVRFPSNKYMAAQLIREIAPRELHYFSFIDLPPAARVERNPRQERAAEQLSFPSETHPYWQALSGSRRLLDEANRPAAVTFEGAEIPVHKDALNHSVVIETLRKKVSHAAALCDRDVLRNLTCDPWAYQIWGDSLCTLLRSLYSLTESKPQLKCDGPASFGKQLAHRIRERWKGILYRLPITSRVATYPGDVKAVSWGQPMRSISGDANVSLTDYLDSVAASVLFRCLRRGGHEL